jgi:hypothetical protein
VQVNLKIIKCKGLRNEWFYLIPIGDTHIGNLGFDEQKLRKLVKWIKEKKNVFWIGMGDYCECISYTDKRFDPQQVPGWLRDKLDNMVASQVTKFVDILEPIKDKCLGLHEGNHDRKIRIKSQYDVVYEIWRAFGIKELPLLKDAAITRLRFEARNNSSAGSYSFDIFSVHGNTGGRMGGAKLNRLEQLIGFFDADVYLMAHSHIKLTESKMLLYIDNKLNLKYKKKILAVTGCFLNGYTQGSTSYVEKMMLPPTCTGVVKIMINPRKGDIHISE